MSWRSWFGLGARRPGVNEKGRVRVGCKWKNQKDKRRRRNNTFDKEILDMKICQN
jgi:hypothetical protein